jgi:hypothetical protein
MPLSLGHALAGRADAGLGHPLRQLTNQLLASFPDPGLNPAGKLIHQGFSH